MDSMYDEFGNYTGPELDDDDDDQPSPRSDGERDTEDWEQDDEKQAPAASPSPQQHRAAVSSASSTALSTLPPAAAASYSASSALVPQYYPSNAELYGPDTDIVVGDEDSQRIEQPIIAPVVTSRFALTETALPACSWDWRFFAGLMDHPDLIRHVVVLGALHHGKTALLDVLVRHTHALRRVSRYTDTRLDEQQRGISLKSCPMSFVLQRLNGKSHLINCIDTPGHIAFSDEATAAIRLADTALLVVDVAEGVLVQTQRLLAQAVREGLRVVLLLNKIDRLILELKLPPTDAYHKLVHCIEQVNAQLAALGYALPPLSPLNNTVCFASTSASYVFSLRSFAKLYAAYHPSTSIDYAAFARRLWGNQYLLPSGRFSSSAPSPSSPRSFLQFILEPLYKLYAHTLGSEGKELQSLLSELGVTVTATELRMGGKELLVLVLGRFFGGVEALAEMLVEHGLSPVAAAEAKVRRLYTGVVKDGEEGEGGVVGGMLRCERAGAAMLQITKQYCRHDSAVFDSFGRVYSGTVKVGDSLRVLGESFTLDDDEDSSVRTVGRIWIHQGRYRVELSAVSAGNLALFEGIDAPIIKTATVTTAPASVPVCIFRPLQFDTISTMKVAIEPINPSELPRMLEALRKVDKSYPLASTRVEESGEHVLLGTGELYLDSALYDLRNVYGGGLEVRVSDPVVRFAETVHDVSSAECRAATANSANSIVMIAEPLEAGIADEIETGTLRLVAAAGAGGTAGTPVRGSGPLVLEDASRQRLETVYGWDVLQSRSIWAFGPDEQGANILVDETLPAETNRKLLYSTKDSIVQGFQWATRAGPLCEEAVRGVRFRLLSAVLSADPLLRPRNQFIPASRRAVYASFLTAAPRLLEPVYTAHILCPADCIPAIDSTLRRRRGHLASNAPVPGSPLYAVTAALPLIDSFGWEVDLRTHTQGQAAVQLVFDHWDTVPGDPMDEAADAGRGVLERAEGDALAREFMIKTRRRKGLVETVDVSKYR